MNRHCFNFKNRKMEGRKSVGKNVEIREPSFTVGENENWGSYYEKNI